MLACPLNMQEMPGALQVLTFCMVSKRSALVTTKNPLGSLDLTAQAMTVFQQALLPHPLWLGPPRSAIKARWRSRLVSAALTHLTKAEKEGPHLPGGTVLHVYGCAVDASPEPEWLVITNGQQPTSCAFNQRHTRVNSSAQDYTFEALHRVYFHDDAWRVQPVLDASGSELVLPPQPGLLVHGCCWLQPSATPDVLSVSDGLTEEDEHGVQRDSSCPLLRRQMPQWPTKKQVKQSLSIASPQSRLPCRAQCVTVLPPPLRMRVIALAIIRPSPKHVQHKTNCWQQKMRQSVHCHRRALTPKVTAPHRTS